MIFQLAICLDFLTFGDLLTLAAINNTVLVEKSPQL
jgi:hypothetical protein